MSQKSMHSPIGDITIFEHDGAIVALDWGWGDGQQSTPLLSQAIKELNEYFDGARETFTLPLNPFGTDFQMRLWAELSNIPYGGVSHYGALATKLNSHARAVGGACGKNPIPIIIPCHRVLGKNDAIGGYSGEGGKDTKIQLLRLEGFLKL